jgi:hypothetical protein
MVMGVILVLALAPDGVAGLPLERILPEPVALRVRMLSLREGMSAAEVHRRLGLEDRMKGIYAYTVIFASTVSHSYAIYPIGQTRRLRLDYALTGRGLSHGLTKATLEESHAE